MRLGRTSLALAVLTGTLPLYAQPSGSDKALATALFEEGRALMAERRYADACPKLAESQRLDPGGGTLLNLAVCHEGLGLTATAWSEFHEALAVAERDGVSERIALANEHIDALAARLTRLTLEVPVESDVPGLAIERDGSPVTRAAWGVSTPIDPGTHRIVATAPGRQPWTTSVELGPGGDTATVRVPPLPAVASAPVRAAPPPKPPRARAPLPARPKARSGSALPWVLGAVGGVAWTVSGYAAWVAHDRDRQSDQLCTPGCTERGLELNHDARTAADVATVSFSIGALALASAVYFWVAEPAGATTAKSPGAFRF